MHVNWYLNVAGVEFKSLLSSGGGGRSISQSVSPCSISKNP